MAMKTEEDLKQMFKPFVEKLYENGYITKAEYDDLKTQELQHQYIDTMHPDEGYLEVFVSKKERYIEVEPTLNIKGKADWEYSGLDAVFYGDVSHFVVHWEFGEDKLKVKN
jgi:membrane peptidoglycan carboxypeptidase